MRIIDLSYHASYLDLSPEAYLKKAESNIGYSRFLKDEHDLTFIFHSAFNKRLSRDGVTYIFRKKRFNSKWLLPLSLTSLISRMKPDVILVHSIIYIHFAAFLKPFLPGRTVIFIQNHAEKIPKSGLKKIAIRRSEKAIKGFLFTSRELAKPWVNQRMIASDDKVYELMEGSSSFVKKDKGKCRSILGIADVETYIWVGRLDSNKDPLCVLKAFRAYAEKGYDFKLYMFYNSEDLLSDIQKFIADSGLQESVELKGSIAHDKLELWYNASDYFVAASYFEGSGYSLCEAMSCGCIPILSDIPSFRYMTAEGRVAALFSPGDENELYQRLEELRHKDLGKMKSKVLEVYENRLSFSAIATKMKVIYGLEK